MKKLLNMIGALAIVIGLAGCGDVSLVKGGTLEFDKSLTIGEAFENYKYFKSVSWEELTTDNGKKIVQVNAVINMDEHPKGAEWKKNVQEMKIVFQFSINKDETFDVTYAGMESIALNGEKNEYDANNIQLMQNLKEIYANTPLS